jgi:hypothetical protein
MSRVRAAAADLAWSAYPAFDASVGQNSHAKREA